MRVAAVDVGDRDELATLLAGERLTGVVHAAGVADNSLVADLTMPGIESTLRAKADAAWHLHELTRDHPLTAFVLFSSAGGLVLAAGQGGYATANVFLDELAVLRRDQGLPATSIAFGLWDVTTGLSAGLGDADRQRLRRQGLPPLDAAVGLELFDAAAAGGSPRSVAIAVDMPALRARTDEVPALLRGLASARPRAAVEAPDLRATLAGLPGPERVRRLLDHVRMAAATVLGHERRDAVAPARGFLELGFDSLTALELRNRITASTGVRLPPTLIFDHPTAQAVADHLDGELFGGESFGGSARPGERDVRTADADELLDILDAELESL